MAQYQRVEIESVRKSHSFFVDLDRDRFSSMEDEYERQESPEVFWMEVTSSSEDRITEGPLFERLEAMYSSRMVQTVSV